MTASVRDSRVTPHMVEPAAMSPYTPGWMHVPSPTRAQSAHTHQLGNWKTSHCTMWPMARPMRPPTTMDGM